MNVTTVDAGVAVVTRALWRLYKNFFQPTLKLRSKRREGGKIHRRYEKGSYAESAAGEVWQPTRKATKQLQQLYESQNVAELRRKIDGLRDRLFRMVANKPGSDGIQLRRKRRGVGISIQRWARSQVLHRLRTSK